MSDDNTRETNKSEHKGCRETIIGYLTGGTCRYCGGEFPFIDNHEKHCPKNPDYAGDGASSEW